LGGRQFCADALPLIEKIRNSSLTLCEGHCNIYQRCQGAFRTFEQIIWDLDDEPDGNVQHLAEHGVTREEAEEVLLNPANEVDRSRSSDNWLTFGETSTGKHIVVVWELVLEDPRIAYPVTAYPTPRRRKPS
jgi:hypothetical protein